MTRHEAAACLLWGVALAVGIVGLYLALWLALA
jgi:hypothetical protein